MARGFVEPAGGARVDFRAPPGEPALVPPDSVAWQVFRNPVSLFVGGVAAVILELAEPRVRAGVWDNSSFRTDPIDRLRRTGLAAMVTVYAGRGVAERMIAGIRRIHERIEGVAETGESYRANDPELLDWVQATACFGFLEAYCAYVRPLCAAGRDSFYAESLPAARLYGATGAPASEAEMHRLMNAMRPRLGRSPVISEFLRIMRDTPLLPAAARPLQRLFVRAAIDILPSWFGDEAGLEGPRPAQRALVRAMARMSGRIRLDRSPPAQASIRLGLPPNYLWKASPSSG